MIQGKEYDDEIDLGDIEALQVCRNSQPESSVRHLAWKAMEKGLKE